LHFFITGHTGFKGTWLTHLLRNRGHVVSGYSDIAELGSLFTTTDTGDLLKNDFRGDVRDLDTLSKAILKASPEIVIHLAAQSLVPKSYLYPFETFSINVDGTRNVLAATKNLNSLLAILIVTTDKVYRDSARPKGFIESDVLGGYDPYSTSKVMADLMTQSIMNFKYSIPIGIARAGNVIGGGDTCEQRLLPDVLRSLAAKSTLELRNPNAIRPWQHVLDCLSAYLFMIESLIQSKQNNIWNVGPNPSDYYDVNTVVTEFLKVLDKSIEIKHRTNQIRETKILRLNSDKLRKETGWRNKLNFNDSVRWTAEWYESVLSGEISTRKAVAKQIAEFTAL
jgi:CDP-glucose 4,6-dehydratase